MIVICDRKTFIAQVTDYTVKKAHEAKTLSFSAKNLKKLVFFFGLMEDLCPRIINEQCLALTRPVIKAPFSKTYPSQFLFCKTF